MSNRQEFLRKMGLSEDDMKEPAVGKAVDVRPVAKGEVAVDDTFIRTAALADTEALKASPTSITSKTVYREEQLKKFREQRVATIQRELGLEDGVQQHDSLLQQGQGTHGAAVNYKAQLLADFRKKQTTSRSADEKTQEL